MPKKALSESSTLESSSKSKSSYISLDQREHLLLRPDTYIGSTKFANYEFYGAVCKDETITIEKKQGLINNGLHRLFIEILSNACDNWVRSKNSETPSTKIKIDINRETGEITVWNDGQTIEIAIDEKLGIYNPEMILGMPLGCHWGPGLPRGAGGLKEATRATQKGPPAAEARSFLRNIQKR